MNRKHYLKDIRKINSMKELQYHKLRLELATDYLEDKIEGNIKGIKYELSPIRLLRMLFLRLFKWGKHKTADGQGPAEEEPHDSIKNTEGLLNFFMPIVEEVLTPPRK